MRPEPKRTENEIPVDPALLQLVVEIARARAALLAELRAAIERHDDTVALRLARRLCGIEEQR